MRIKNKVGKKIATLVLAAAMAVGGSLSVFAATGFIVTNPSLSYLNKVYFVTGSMAYTAPSNTSTSYYLQVKVTGIAKNGQSYEVYDQAGYGYGTASATTTMMPARPIYIENQGSYNTGAGGFIIVETKGVNNP